MNARGQSFMLGVALITAGFVLMLGLFSTLEPLKEGLNNNRGASTLNCLDASDFNQTNYNDDSRLEQLTRRPTCFITGMYIFIFFGIYLIAILSWIYRNWRRS